MSIPVCVPALALALALVGYAFFALGGRRLSAARRHLALRGLLVVCCVLPLLAPLLLFVPKIPVVAVPARVVQTAPSWTPGGLLPDDGWRVRGTALDETFASRRSAFDAALVWNAANLLVIGLLSLATWRAGVRLRAVRTGAAPGGEFEGIPVLLASDPRLAVPITFDRTILLPASASDWPEGRRHAALLHEEAHVRRGDWGWTLAARAACTFFWYSPGLWLVARALRATAEEAADDAVLAAGVRPSDYARELLAVSRALSAPSIALPMVGRGGLRGRVRAVLAPRRDRRRATRAFGLAAGVLLTGLALVSAGVGVRMPSLTMKPPPGARIVRPGEVVRRGGTTFWLDSIHSVTMDRVVSWDASGGPTQAVPAEFPDLLYAGTRNTTFCIETIRHDPDDAYAFRYPSSVGLIASTAPRPGTRRFQIDVGARSFDAKAFSTDLAVGVASGPWSPPIPIDGYKTIDRQEGLGTRTVYLQFGLPRPARDAQCRATVRLTNGRIAAPRWQGASWRSWGPDQVGQVQVRLAPDEHVASLEVEARPYRWVLMRNVPLVPGPAARAKGRRPILRRLRVPAPATYHVEGVR